MAAPRKSQIAVSSRGDAARTANVALARRLAGNVHGGGSRSIPLKEPKRWHVYIANTYANENEFYEMREKGWVPLEVSDLACPVEESGFRLENGALVRGEKGREMAWKMDAADYKLLEMAKRDQNMRGIGSAKKVKADMAEAAASQHGSEAADFIHNMPGQVIDSLVDRNAQ